MIGALNGWVLMQGELPWAMAKDGVFPPWLAKLSRFGTPARAHVVASLLLTAVLALNYTRTMTDLFGFLILLATAASLAVPTPHASRTVTARTRVFQPTPAMPTPWNGRTAWIFPRPTRCTASPPACSWCSSGACCAGRSCGMKTTTGESDDRLASIEPGRASMGR